MDLQQRLDLFDFDVPHDDELPDYESTRAPEYTPEYSRGNIEIPLHTYHLRQLDRRHQSFVPFGPTAPTSYKATARGARLFSKKPELEMWRIENRGNLIERMASIRFDNDGPMPWRPRAHFDHEGGQGTITCAMESKNFMDWTVAIGGTTYVWVLGVRPVSLELIETASPEVIARFIFSGHGMTATDGNEVGDLIIYQHARLRDADGVEQIVCGLMVVIANFRKMGKYYCNDEKDPSMRAGSLAVQPIVPHRGSVASHATI
jgi:hypothetical protein